MIINGWRRINVNDFYIMDSMKVFVNVKTLIRSVSDLKRNLTYECFLLVNCSVRSPYGLY